MTDAARLHPDDIRAIAAEVARELGHRSKPANGPPAPLTAEQKRQAEAEYERRLRRKGKVRASHLLQGTWTPRPLRLEEVQVWLGHASITTTQRYSHLGPDTLHRAIRPNHAEGER